LEGEPLAPAFIYHAASSCVCCFGCVINAMALSIMSTAFALANSSRRPPSERLVKAAMIENSIHAAMAQNLSAAGTALEVDVLMLERHSRSMKTLSMADLARQRGGRRAHRSKADRFASCTSPRPAPWCRPRALGSERHGFGSHLPAASGCRRRAHPVREHRYIEVDAFA
jgi:hypothetical protein